MHAPDETTPSARQHHSPELWSQARDEYLAGASAPEVCARYGPFRDRAKKEGWRRADCADSGGYAPPPFDYAAELDSEGRPPSPVELSNDAWQGLVRTIRHDRPREAVAWLRLYRALAQFAREEGFAFQHPVVTPRPAAERPRVRDGAALPETPEAVAELDLEGLAAVLEFASPADLDPPVLEALLARAHAEFGDEWMRDGLDELDGPDLHPGSPIAAGTRMAA